MQTDIHALVILYVDSHLLRQMQRMALFSFHALEISPYHVVGLAGGNPLGKFTYMIGSQFPLRLPVARAADPDLHTVDGAIVRSPDRSKDKSIAICWFQFLRRWDCKNWRHDSQIRRGERKYKQETERRQDREGEGEADATSHRRLPPPLLLPLPRSRPRPPSVPEDWSSQLQSRCRTRDR